MKYILSKLSFAFLLLCFAIQLTAQTNQQNWKKAPASSIAKLSKDSRDISPQQGYIFELNLDAFTRQLYKAPLRFNHSDNAVLPTIDLPMPDGTARQFKVMEAPVMHPDLQSRFPDIRSYAGYEVRNPSTTIRFDISPNGLSAMILSDEGTFFIDPYSYQNTAFYTSYNKKDFVTDKLFDCKVEHIDIKENLNTTQTLRSGDGMMRKYRLALGANAEYSNYHGASSVANVAKVIAAMNKTMTRVNGIYEKELSITMEIIANTDKLIFYNISTDGYTNDSGSKMLGEHQSKCDNLIGTANYDIGHVFSTGGGGIANLEAPCKSNSKAKGVTGLDAPKGDPFDIDYVAHEMGHQFGGEHTYNNSCSNNRSASTSYEPGSGSTIMAYAGICPPNVQSNSDAYFHAISIEQINTYTTLKEGNSCPQKIQTTNQNAPVVDAGVNYTIPQGTPFELMGKASDKETSTTDLTYCWEQYNKEIVPMAPTGTATSGPLFRSVNPSKNNIRIFPNLNNIVRNTKNTWEVLSKTARTINFRLTVRDNDLNGGRSSADDMQITVTSDGPFLVTYPDTAKIVWVGGQNQTVKWNVANTNSGAINTPQVTILLSSDGGYTYPDTLAKSIANTGIATIKVPEKNIAKARIKIKGVNNVFFDISNNDFIVEKPLIPSFTLNPDTNEGKLCKSQADSFVYNIEVGSIAGFNESVKLSTKGLPPNALIKFSQDEITPSGKIKITVYNLKNVNSGLYAFNILAKSATLKDSLALNLSIFQNLTNKVTITNPLAYERGFGTKSPFVWRKLNSAERYAIEISKNESFQPLEETAIVTDTQYIAKKLLPIQIYYWRVKALNPCNETEITTSAIFQTGSLLCDTLTNNTVVDIPATINEISSKVEVTRKATIGEVSIYAKIDHTYLSDLETSIESPNGNRVTLFSGICNDRNNADAIFDDAGGTFNCTLNTITLRGRFKPQEPLVLYRGEQMKGNWTLRIKDNKAGDAGTLKTWNLRVCNNIIADEKFIVETDTLKVKAGDVVNIPQDYLVATSIGTVPDKITYKILALPKNGTLKRGTGDMAVGSLITQQQINTGALFYVADPNTNFTRDSFLFESVTEKGGWIPSSSFYINIIVNTIKVTTNEVKNVNCFGANDGRISINATGGQQPLTYSLNGGVPQNNNNFNDLSKGEYIVSVKDVLGFSNKIIIKIGEPSKIAATTKIDSNNVTLNISGGTSPYRINYDKKGFASSNTFTNQSNGWHSYVVKDANNCELKDSFKLNVNTLNVIASAKNPSCFQGNDGSVAVAAKGGRSPYTYALGVIPFQQDNIFSNLPAGIYTAIVRDADSLQRNVTVSLIAPSAVVATAKTQRDSLVITASGGTTPYQFSIDNGANYQNSNVFTKIANASYTILVKDANACTKKIENYQFTDVIEQAEALGISFMPNPTNDILNIAFKTAFDSDVKVNLLNLQGQIVIQDNINKGINGLTLRVGHLPKGVYFIRLKGSHFETGHKILIGL